MLPDMRWAIDDILVRSSRPGFPDRHVQQDTVDGWLDDVKAMGVRSILCLLSDRQFKYYRDIPEGVLERYRSWGFVVEHISIEDPAYSLSGYDQIEANRERICEAFDHLPKPVLVHCSAGLDRTGYAVRFIERRLAGEDNTEQESDDEDEL